MTDAGASGPSSGPPRPPVLPGAHRSISSLVLGAVIIGALIVVAVLVLVSTLRHKGSKHAAEPATVNGPTTTIANHPASAPVGFEAETLRIVDSTGKAATFCVLVADVEPLRQQGLMWVTDPKLGGYDGMLFTWPNHAAVTDTFWMHDTPLPLSVAFFAADGHLISTADMAPCGDQTNCPTYAAAAPYVAALEVPQGRLGALGIAPGSKTTEQGTGTACGKSAGT